MNIWHFLGRAANVVGVLMAFGALGLIVYFMVHLWGAYYGQPASSSIFGG